MSLFIYNLCIWFITIFVMPVWLLFQTLKGKPVLPYFLGFSQQELASVSGKKIIWIQSASVGETMVAARLLQELRKVIPEYAIIFTCITQTGYATAEKVLKDLVNLIGYLPFDHPWVVKRFLARLNPALLILVETEIWPNSLYFTKKHGAKIAIINGRLDKSYNRLKKFNFFKPFLRLIDLVAVQSTEDYQRFISMGALPENVKVLGNIKFDFNYPVIDGEEQRSFLTKLGLNPQTPIFTAASTHHGEETIIIKAFKRVKQELPSAFMLLAPRYPDEAESIAGILSENGLKWELRTKMLQGQIHSRTFDVLIIDTFGELGLVYSLSTVAFVGGSLIDIGGHNILEAAAQAKIVLFGPYMDNVREISSQLEEQGVGFTVSNGIELADYFLKYAKNQSFRDELGKKAKQIISSNQGATQKTIDNLTSFFL